MENFEDSEDKVQRSLTLPLISIGLILGYFVSQALSFIIAGQITGRVLQEMSSAAKFISISGNAFLWIIISTIIIKILRLPKYDSKKIDEQWTFYIIGVLLLYTSMILFGYLAQEVGFTPKKQDVAKQVIQMSETSIFLVILGPALLIPIVEELLFRSLLYRSLKFSLSPLLAAIISASLFGFAHIEPDTIPQLIIIGLILSYVYEKSGSIIIPIALHATNNFVTIIILVYFPKLSGV